MEIGRLSESPPRYGAVAGKAFALQQIRGLASPSVDYDSPQEGEEVVETTKTCTAARPRLTIPRKLAYGVGHVFNDLCASMWFTYLVLFYHKVVELGNTYAGMLILIGQLADALATPVIGFLCDLTHVRYGRRKLWHLIGTCMVAVSLFFFWHKCLGCKDQVLWIKMIYFSIPIIIFQFGWASVQISHLSLIPELTSDKSERVGLNAIRYSRTVAHLILFYTPTRHCRKHPSVTVHIKGQSNKPQLCPSSCHLM